MIRKSIAESLPIWKSVLTLLVYTLIKVMIIIFLQIKFGLDYEQYKVVFSLIEIVLVIYIMFVMIKFAYMFYTEELRKLDVLLKEFETDEIRFDLSFPKEFIKGVYDAEGLKSKDITFVKKMDAGVKKLDNEQCRLAMVFIRNYNKHSLDFVSFGQVISFSALFVSVIGIIDFNVLENNLIVLGVVVVFIGAVLFYAYDVYKRKSYICNVLEDLLQYHLSEKK